MKTITDTTVTKEFKTKLWPLIFLLPLFLSSNANAVIIVDYRLENYGVYGSPPGEHVIYRNGGQYSGYAGASTVNYGDVTLESGSSASHYAGSSVHNFGNVNLNAGSNVNYYSGSNFTVYGGSRVNNSGSVLLESGVSGIYLPGSTYNGLDGSYVYNDADIINQGNITIGAGSIVEGNGSYTQNNGGTIIVNGEVTQSSINIQGSGYLGGSGTINGNVYAAGNDVIINSGNSPGTLNVNGLFTALNGTSLIFEIGSSAHDVISIVGDINLDNVNIAFDFLDGMTESALFDYTLDDFFQLSDANGNSLFDVSLFDSSTFMVMINLGGFDSRYLTADGSFSYTSVPEPTMLFLFATGMPGLLLTTRFKKHRFALSTPGV